MKPAEPVREGYLFTGWSEESNNVLSDLIIIALYDKIIPQEYYQVTFNLNGGTLITGKTIQYLKAGEKPLPPVPVKDMAEFIGWDTEIKECNEDITYNAQYHELTIKRQTAQEFINTITFGWSYVGGN